jgi:hypothetical protein
MSNSSLKLDWCSHAAAKHAVESWHYSRCFPAGKTVKIGVWEDSIFIGCVIFSRGANCDLGRPYGLTQLESCELTRVALNKYKSPVSRIVAIALKLLKQQSPGIKLVISFADPEHAHVGGIYQAMGWIYAGMSKASEEYIVNGVRMHGRSMRAKYGTHLGKDFIKTMKGSAKHRYLMALDNSLRTKLESVSRPYPKRVQQANPGAQLGSGGAAPTHTLQRMLDILKSPKV